MPKIRMAKTQVIDGTLFSVHGVYTATDDLAVKAAREGVMRELTYPAPKSVRGIVSDVYYRRNVQDDETAGRPLFVSVNCRLSASVAHIVLPALQRINQETMRADYVFWTNSDGTARIEASGQSNQLDEFIAAITNQITHYIFAAPSDYYLNFVYADSAALPSLESGDLQTTPRPLAELFDYLVTVSRIQSDNDAGDSMPLAYGRHSVGKGLVYYSESK